MPTCPAGHDSTDPDFCDVCGMRIGGPATGAAPAPGDPPADAASGAPSATDSGAAWPAAKLYPHVSQNCPDRSAPHRGHAAAAGPACAGAGAPTRIPQTSQKSVLGVSWPSGQVGMPASLTSWS